MDTNKTKVISRQVYNQLKKLLVDEDVLRFIKEQQATLEKERTFATIAQCKRAINHFLQKKKLPVSWAKPLLKIIKDKEVDFPDNNSIFLRVGSEEVTGAMEGFVLIRDKEGNLLDEPTISIVISAKTSTDQIIKFVEQHKKEIEYYQDILDLPVYKNIHWKDIDFGLKILQMKDKENMTFSEIASKFLEKENLTDKEQDYYGNENTIKAIYYRYRKRFPSK